MPARYLALVVVSLLAGCTAVAEPGDCVLAREEFSYNGELRRVLTYGYDDEGRRIREERDEGADGSINQALIYRYDPLGQLVREERDEGADGTADWIRTHVYDDAGHRIRSEEDRGADGRLEIVLTFTYDARGNLLREASDWDDNGSTDEVSTYVYIDDLLSMKETKRYSGGAILRLHTVWTYRYSDAGDLIRRERDNHADGSIDRVLTRSYDPDRNLVQEELDNVGGSWGDRVSTFSYDADGRLVRSVVDRWNEHLEVDRFIVTFGYAAAGYLLWEKTEEQAHYGDVTLTVRAFFYDCG
jgi:hypothetical protein